MATIKSKMLHYVLQTVLYEKFFLINLKIVGYKI